MENDEQTTPVQRDPQSWGTVDANGQITGHIAFMTEDGKAMLGDLSGHYLSPTVSNIREIEVKP